jgi:hypothetical protein
MRIRVILMIFSAAAAVAQTTSMTINCGPGAPAQAGVNYSNVCGVNGGTPPYRWSVDLLPLGLEHKTISSSIAIQVTGVPAGAGPFAYEVSVSDSSTPGSLSARQIVAGTIAPWAQTSPIISGVFGAGLSNPPVT